MTTPRKVLPRAAQNAVEQAAIRVTAAIKVLKPLQEERLILHDELLVRTLRAETMLQEALRWLETDAKAPTRPESL